MPPGWRAASRGGGHCNHGRVQSLPAGIVDGRKLPRRLRVNGGGAWFLAGPGSFERVGAGDLSLGDLQLIAAELGNCVFVALPALQSLQEYLGGPGPRPKPGAGPTISTSILGASRRVQRYEQRRDETPPSIGAVAKGAQVAVLPKIGPVWVDGHRLFRPGEKATLPWTEPRVELVSVRPAVVRSAMRAAIGPRGPRRAKRAVPQEQAEKA